MDKTKDNRQQHRDDIADRIAKNLRYLRDGRGMTQEQLATLADLPRATLANLESGTANPTIRVLHKLSLALQIPLEELIAPQRAAVKFYPKDQLVVKRRGNVQVRKLLPDPIPGVEIDRMELPPKSQLIGVPHTVGTREYLTAETGEITLHAGGETWQLGAGDVVVFRGDQKHSYENPSSRPAIAYSVVLLGPVE